MTIKKYLTFLKKKKKNYREELMNIVEENLTLIYYIRSMQKRNNLFNNP